MSAAVVVVLEINGFFVDVANHLHGQRSHAALGVTRGSGWVVAWGTEVTLTGYQRVAQVPVLNQTHEGVIDCAVTVRVELTHDVTDDARALAELLVWAVAAVIHRIEHGARPTITLIA